MFLTYACLHMRPSSMSLANSLNSKVASATSAYCIEVKVYKYVIENAVCVITYIAGPRGKKTTETKWQQSGHCEIQHFCWPSTMRKLLDMY